MGMFLSLGSMVRTGWFAIPAILFCCSLVGFGQEPQLGNKAGSVEQSDRTSEPVSGSEAEDGLGVHGYAKSGSVRIHYVALGDGPLLIMIHGFPDYWYTWREQMPELSKHFRVVAIDQRGYNYSDKPEGVANYGIDYLVSDIAAVIKHFNTSKAVVVGHDWGGMVAWSFALKHPEMTDRLIILNLPHPNGLRRELATNPDQQKNSAYARFFQSENASQLVKKETLVGWVKDPKAKTKYLEAMDRSSLELSTGALYRYRSYRSQGSMPSADVPRAQGQGIAGERAQWNVGLARKGSYVDHYSGSGPLCSTGCIGCSHEEHGRMVNALIDFFNGVIAKESRDPASP